MELLKMSQGKFKSLIKKNLSMDLIYLLLLSKEGINIRGSFSEEPRILSLISTLERKGYIIDGRINKNGEELYKSLLNEEEEIVIKRLENKDKEWEEFLSYYPPNNRFVWKNKLFEGDRGIKCNTKAGKELFTKALNEGLTGEQLWRAVVAECISKMEYSYKKGENQMKYFNNTESYLRQQKYMNWISEGKELTIDDIALYREAYNRNRKKVAQTKKGTVDI